ncbi:MAG TPA: HD domain-containing protein, partial [Chthonomonadales bacterium]|nr:HD domain-containing protein [Chthonomonadales bacterium]
QELIQPRTLLLAALLHDAGKAYPDRPHSEVGAEVCAAVCARLGWSEEDASMVEFLTRNHLLMAETSRLRDLSLEETIREFVAVVDDVEKLNRLYLLTYADTRAVGEGVWTQVNGRFLRDLWRRASALLTEEEAPDYDDATMLRTRRRLLRELSLENIPEAEVSEHVLAMPPDYLLNQSLQEMVLHIGYVRRVREGAPVIDFRDERDATYSEITVVAFDDPTPGLLAKITGALYACDLNVHSAQVLTRTTERDRIALDTLWVDYRGRQLSPGKRREVAGAIDSLLTGAQNVTELLAARKKRAAGGEDLRVRSVTNDLSETLTVVEVVGTDTGGALYRCCAAISSLGWDIRSARVSSWQGEVRDSFYIVGARGMQESDVSNALKLALEEVPVHAANK